MSLANYLRGVARRSRARTQQRELLKQTAPQDIPRDDWSRSLADPTSFYLDCFRYFHTRLPEELREHRRYFARENRGFGEDAFHVLWFLLFRQFRPRAFLEIGVYRGQTLSLAALLQRALGCAGETVGISPFSSAGDSVSRYRAQVNYLEDTLANFAHFSLPKPALVKAFSTDAEAKQMIASRPWDCVYIDGNHDYEIARQDWDACSRATKSGGILVLDDSALTTKFSPPLFATAGHPGPSRLANEIKSESGFREILQVGHNRAFQKC